MPDRTSESGVVIVGDDSTIDDSGEDAKVKSIDDLENMGISLSTNKLNCYVDIWETIPLCSRKISESQLSDKTTPHKKGCYTLIVRLDCTPRFREHVEYVCRNLEKLCG